MPREKITHERRHIRTRLEMLDALLNSNDRRTYKQLLAKLNHLLEQNGEIPISERTLKYDITHLECKEGAPIHRPSKGNPCIYYTELFSYKGTPVDKEDIALLKQAVAILKQATDIKLPAEIDAIISKLQNTIDTNVEDSNLMIAFEEHTKSEGQQHFQKLFDAIQEKCSLKITYQPFKKEERVWIISPYMLKEYNNRWYLIGRENEKDYALTIALDRIKKIGNCTNQFEENNLFEPETYFNKIIGVTFPEEKTIQEIIIKVNPRSTDYILTKPIHKSQVKVNEYTDGSITVKFQLYINDELRHYLLGYGPRIEIVQPDILREEIKELIKQNLMLYIKNGESD